MNYDDFYDLIHSKTASEAELIELIKAHSHEEPIMGCDLCETLWDIGNSFLTELIQNQTSRLKSKTFERALFDLFKIQNYSDGYWMSQIAEDLGFSELADEEMFTWALEGVKYRANSEFEIEFELEDMEGTLEAIRDHSLYNSEKSKYSVEELALDIHYQRTVDGIDACSGEFEECEPCQSVLKRVLSKA